MIIVMALFSVEQFCWCGFQFHTLSGTIDPRMYIPTNYILLG